MEDDNLQINLSWYMPSFPIDRNLANKNLAESIHKTLSEYFSNFEVIIERIERDGKDRLIGCHVGVVRK